MSSPHQEAGRPKIEVGWKEFVEFVDWGTRVKTKIDTGARTSALDVSSYELHDDGQGGQIAELHMAIDSRFPERKLVVRTPVIKMVVVSNSTALREERPLIEANMRLGPIVKPVRLTVTDRTGMRFRMILGRKALEGDFIVDVSRKYLLKHFTNIKEPRQ